MAYQKVPRPSTVYHLTKKEHLDSILDDGVIRRFDDTECWFCEISGTDGSRRCRPEAPRHSSVPRGSFPL